MKKRLAVFFIFIFIISCSGCIVVSSRGYDSGERWDRDTGERLDYERMQKEHSGHE